jgi:hypothetical protein
MSEDSSSECNDVSCAPASCYRFSLLWVFEVVTIIAVSLALLRNPKVPLTLALALVWSSASGAYLGYRWRTSDDFSSCGRLTMGLSALITFLNAIALGIILGERAKLAGGHYPFTWESHFPLIVMYSLFAAPIGMSLGGIFGVGAAYLRERRKEEGSGTA